MATQPAKEKFEALEEDDEFEEFEDDWVPDEEDQEDHKLWEADWDDEDVEEDFSVQLRNELSKLSEAQK